MSSEERSSWRVSAGCRSLEMLDARCHTEHRAWPSYPPSPSKHDPFFVTKRTWKDRQRAGWAYSMPIMSCSRLRISTSRISVEECWDGELSSGCETKVSYLHHEPPFSFSLCSVRLSVRPAHSGCGRCRQTESGPAGRRAWSGRERLSGVAAGRAALRR